MTDYDCISSHKLPVRWSNKLSDSILYVSWCCLTALHSIPVNVNVKCSSTKDLQIQFHKKNRHTNRNSSENIKYNFFSVQSQTCMISDGMKWYELPSTHEDIWVVPLNDECLISRVN